VDELHRIIQALYGLQDYHRRYFADSPKDTKREVKSIDEDDEDYDEELDFTASGEPKTILRAEETLLAQFISTSHKVIYYTYDFGVNTKWKISYK
jgi:hypothetical protein